jgi:transposase
LPERFGNWHTVYVRLDRWPQNGVLERTVPLLIDRAYEDDRTSADGVAVEI